MAETSKNPGETSEKEEKYWRILDAILLMDITKGHLRWNISDIARRAKVTRPLIYYYFGKSKQEMLDSALKIFGNEFFGLSHERLSLWKDGQILESVQRTRELLSKSPHLIAFYFYWRQNKSVIGDRFVELEEQYISKVRKHFTHLSAQEARSVFAMFFGLCVTPDLSVENILQIGNVALKLMRPAQTCAGTRRGS